jgi:peptidoglycan-associated lipoprotein
MRASLASSLVAALACTSALEPVEVVAPPAQPAPTVVRIADADRPPPPPPGAPAREAARCDEGFVVDTFGVCNVCRSDDECRGGCTLETGRCSAEGWCDDATDCTAGERCDGGLCVHVDAGEGPCGIGTIYFAWDSDAVSPGTKARLSAAADCIANLPGTIFIEGHTDVLGSEEFQILLTDRRGQAVRDLLVSHRVPASKLQVIAKGSLESTGTDAFTRSKDRKVVLIANVPTVP